MTSPRGVLETLAITELALFHTNPRRGDVAAIKASLLANELYKPLVVNRGTRTGRAYEVLAGNHTLMAARELFTADPDDARWSALDCYVIDVDDQRASRIVLVDNKTGQLGGFDEETLAQLLVINLGSDLTGTGYSDAELSDLSALLASPDLGPLTEELSGHDPELSGQPGVGPAQDEDHESDTSGQPDTEDMRTWAAVMPLSQFELAQKLITELRAKYDGPPDAVESNADVLMELLDAYFSAPTI
jgi:hypothetical protein